MGTDEKLHFGQVAIVGVGLLGSSLGLALKARKLAHEVVGIGRRGSSLETAKRIGAIDALTLDLREGLRRADLVVIATPAGAVLPVLDAARAACKNTAVITDVASTKAEICAHAQSTWPAPRRFVGSHPMAGAEQFGPEHGRADLFEGSICLVEENEEVQPQARETVVRLWESVGARVVAVSPQEHDAVLARTSHVPHILAAALAALAGCRGEVRPMIGNGFKDMTRIAAGRAEVWRDICLTNRVEIAEGLEELGRVLEQVLTALKIGDAAALDAFFEAGRRARQRLVDE
ncbi:MAG: prephenate dehydrogenase/arogenate dehydrogenase family protein [Candidatus Hydrogenedentes bacterium]|nr:prephenate dehydrogenase/arogenate dehydrogenase family protein [Candidatus Hydrogenedentota bacterium]MBI3119077.1 prephenate dehydrogenase/arogenate dehydrogenase family protein [Candidatus Hydrogenedentota bacterium]